MINKNIQNKNEEKMIKCQYPKCNKEATKSLSMADPDAEKYYYCDEHVDTAKMNTMMSIFRRDCDDY